MVNASKAPDRVPVINIEPFRLGDTGDKQRVAEEVADVCRTLGFLIVSGHGVSADLIESTYGALREFFGLPLDQKLSVLSEAGGPGYQPLKSTALAKSLNEDTPPDLNERFAIHPVDVGEDDYYTSALAHEWFRPNRWPNEPEGFETTCTQYFGELAELARTLMSLFAVALELDEGYFEGMIDRPISRLSGIGYPPQQGTVVPGQLRAGAHTDYGCITILYKDQGAGGLQVQHPSQGWIDVTPVPGAFIVNIGDLLAQWTNDQWVSTYHRVVNPPREVAISNWQISIPFFHLPNYDAVIEPLPTCVSAESPVKYEPLTAGEHIRMKLGKTFEPQHSKDPERRSTMAGGAGPIGRD